MVRYSREYYQANKQAFSKQQRNYYINNREKITNRELKKYSVSVEEYNAMLEAQNKVCAICKQPETARVNNKVKRLSIDHNHETGKVRGLLCHNCNILIGQAKDNVKILHNAAEYLNRVI